LFLSVHLTAILYLLNHTSSPFSFLFLFAALRVLHSFPTRRSSDLAVRRCGRPHSVHRYREVHWSPARSETPCTYGSTSRGNREIPSSPRAKVALGRIGKSKDARR